MTLGWRELLKKGDKVAVYRSSRDAWITKVVKITPTTVVIEDGTKYRVKDGYAVGTKPCDRYVSHLIEATLTTVTAVKDQRELVLLREEFGMCVEGKKYSFTSTQLKAILKIAKEI